MTIVINLFGGPGAGKSTAAAYIFALLKWQGVKCELITEYAKDRVWEESFGVLKHQEYVFGKQKHRMWRVAPHVDVLITDAPLLHCIHYMEEKYPEFTALVLKSVSEFDNINVFVERIDSHYQEAGRYQDLEGAKEIDRAIIELLAEHSQQANFSVKGEEEGVRRLVHQNLAPLVRTKIRVAKEKKQAAEVKLDLTVSKVMEEKFPAFEIHKKKTVICQAWEESERGWGTRPDGCSLHLTEEDRRAFIKKQNDSLPSTPPDEYSRPCGEPFPLKVDDKTYKKVEKGEFGEAFYQGAYKELLAAQKKGDEEE